MDARARFRACIRRVVGSVCCGVFTLVGGDTAGSPFIAAATYGLTNFIYFQNPYITKTLCPECGTRERPFSPSSARFFHPHILPVASLSGSGKDHISWHETPLAHCIPNAVLTAVGRQSEVTVTVSVWAAQNIFFGDILWVSGDNGPVVNTKCLNKDCGVKLKAERGPMIVNAVFD